MNQSNGSPGVFIEDGHGPAGHSTEPNPLLLVHRRLRGRYTIAIVLGAFMGGLGGFAGYTAQKPEFSSVGIVEIRPTVEKLLYDTEQNQVLPNFDAFVSAQADYLSSSRILRKAVDDEKLRVLNWPAGDQGVQMLSEGLSVFSARRGQTIQVRVSHIDPRSSQAGVNAVLDAYETIYGDDLGMNDDRKLQRLEVRRSQIQSDLKRKRDEIVAMSDAYDADSLDLRYDQSLAELVYYDNQLSTFDRAILDAPEDESENGAQDDGAAPDNEVIGAATMTVAELALKDPTLTALLEERDVLEVRIASLSDTLGANHRQMIEHNRYLGEMNARIERRAQQVAFILQIEAEDASPEETIQSLSRDELVRRRGEVGRVRELVSSRVKDIGRMRRELAALEADTQGTVQLLADTTRRQEELRTESKNSGNRVSITQRGDLPFAPSRDKRVQFGGAGLVGGGGLGVGLVFLLGFFRPTFRYIDEVDEAHQSAPLLGTLPDFSNGNSDDRDMAALAIHHLRNALHVEPHAGVGVVLTVTSAASGDGKTSLAMALGTSFAAAGHRTVVVDSDLVGRGMTREMGFENVAGFSECVHGGDVTSLLQESGVQGLGILPAGKRDVLDPKQMSVANVGPTIDALRRSADVVLIDTGPILGSLEANIVAVLSDTVIVTVSRGQQARLVRATVERLTRMGARCAGLVFNRAAAVDFKHSVSHASIMSKSRTSILDAPTSGERERGGRAALMHAVAGIVDEQESESES